MRRILTASLALLAIPLIASVCEAQISVPQETRNAALRYWMALVDLRDEPSDIHSQGELKNAITGRSPWNEATLGPIIDRNMQAIEEMQRATELPDCDWGIEYSRGARASVSYLMRAGELARLNTAYGVRLMAKGQAQEAVDSWIAGIRFSQDLARGGPVITALVARATLLSDFRAMTNAAQSPALATTQKLRIARAVRSLPPDVFDWGEALGLEEAAYESFAQEIRKSDNPDAAYEKFTGATFPKNYSLPPEEAFPAFRSLIRQAQDALRLPSGEARPRLEQLQAHLGRMGQSFELAVPSFVKINDARAEVEAARAKLLQAVGDN